MNRKLRIVLGLTVLIESSFVASAGAQCYDPMDYMRWSEELFPPAGVPLPSLVRGRFGYSISEASGLQILDIDLERGLTLIGSVDTPGIPSRISLHGNLAVISEGAAGLQIIDVASAESPRIVGSFNAGGISHNAVCVGHFLYVMNSLHGLQIIDIANVSAPVLRSELQVGFNQPGDLKVIGDFLLTIPEYNQDVINIANPDAPFMVGYIMTGVMEPIGTEIIGDHLFVVGNNRPGGHIPMFGQMSSVDISALPSTIVKDEYILSTTVSGWGATEQTVSLNSSGVTQVIDVSSPHDLSTVGAAVTGGIGNIVSIQEALMTPFLDQNGLRYRVIPSVVPGFPTPIAVESGPGLFADLVVRNKKIYGTNGTGFGIVDVSEPTNPDVLYSSGNSSGFYGTTDVEVVGTRMFLTDTHDVLNFFEVSDPRIPTYRGPIPGVGAARDLAAREGFLFVANSEGILSVVDAGYSGFPTVVLQIDFPGQGGRIDVFDQQAVLVTVADGSARVFVLDVTNPIAPITTGELDVPGVGVSGLRVTERAAFLADGWDGVQIVDLSIPGSPRLAGQVSVGKFVDDATSWGDLLVVRGNGMGLNFYDISELDDPRPSGGIPGSGFTGFTPMGNYLCVAGTSGFLPTKRFQVYGPYCGSSVGVDPMAVPLHDRTFQIAPNPATVSTAIQFTNETDRLVQIDIHDVLGRKIRSLHQGMLGAGSVWLPWDCRNDEGASCASGVYFVKIQSGKDKYVERVSILR